MSALTTENIVAYADVDLGRVSRSIRDKDGTVRPERVALKAAYDAAPHYADFRKMLDERKDLDAVIIATPDFKHSEHTVAALKAGKNDEAVKLITSLEEQRNSSHKEYKKQKPKA